MGNKHVAWLVKVFKGLVSTGNRLEMSVSQFTFSVRPMGIGVASGHFLFTLGITWKEREAHALSHSASLHPSENNWQDTSPVKLRVAMEHSQLAAKMHRSGFPLSTQKDSNIRGKLFSFALTDYIFLMESNFQYSLQYIHVTIDSICIIILKNERIMKMKQAYFL